MVHERQAQFCLATEQAVLCQYSQHFTKMMSGWKRSAAGATISSQACSMAASPEPTAPQEIPSATHYEGADNGAV